MSSTEDYAVLGYDRCLAEHDELMELRRENEQLRAALNAAVASHQEIQERLADEGDEDA